MGFCLENYYCEEYENDGDNGGGGGGDADVAAVGGGGVGTTKGNGNDSIVHITVPQLVSLGWDDMYHPQYVSCTICVHLGNVE
jgi:hypothetical protein